MVVLLVLALAVLPSTVTSSNSVDASPAEDLPVSEIPTIPAASPVEPVIINGPSTAESPQNAQPATSAPVQAAAEPAVPPVEGCEQYRALVAQYSWNVNVAMAVMQAESGCRPNAENPEAHYDARGNFICSGSYGLFQISCHGGVITDPAANIAAAWAKYQDRGWQPWGVCNRRIVICF